MEKDELNPEDLSTIDTQIRAIRVGQASYAEGTADAPLLAEEDFTAMKEGRYAQLSMSTQYWAGRYYKIGAKIHKKNVDQQRKILTQPASLGDVHGFLAEMVHGKNGIYENLEYWKQLIDNYVVTLREALFLKGLLTEEDMEAARASLRAKAEALVPKIEAEATATVNALDIVEGEKVSG